MVPPRARSGWWKWLPSALVPALLVAGDASAQRAPATRVAEFTLARAWTVRLPATADRQPAVDRHRVYVSVRGLGLLSFSLDDGRRLWSTDVRPVFTPSIAGDRVLTVTPDAIEALDAAAGSRAWRLPLPQPAASPPGTGGGWLVVGLRSGEILAVNAANGAVIWRRELGAPASASPIVVGDLACVGLTDGRVTALGIEDGSLRWARRLGDAVTGLHAAAGTLFAGSRDNFLYALSLGDGRVRWRWRTGADLIGAAASDASRVYFASLDTILRALDLHTGAQRWKRAVPARPLAGPALVDGVLLLPGLMPDVVAYRVTDGQPVGRTRLDVDLAAPPVLADYMGPGWRRVVVVTEDGHVTALERPIAPPLVPFTELPGSALPVPEPVPALPAVR